MILVGEEKSDGNAKGKRRRVRGMENGSIDRERKVNRDERRMREGKARGRVCDGSESSRGMKETRSSREKGDGENPRREERAEAQGR